MEKQLLNFGHEQTAERTQSDSLFHWLNLSDSLRMTWRNAFAVMVGFLLMGCASTAHQHTRSLISGNRAALEGDFIEAAKQYEAALNDLPESTTAQRNLGIVLVKIGDYRRAIKYLTGIYENYKTDPEVQYFLGEAYRGDKKFMTAADHYQLGLRINPSDMRLTKALGWAWHKMGRNDWSINLLTTYLTTVPGDHQIKLILANAHNTMKQFKQAAVLLSFVESKSFKTTSQDNISAEAERMLLLSTYADSVAGLGDCSKAQSIYREVIRFRPFFDKALIGSAQCALTKNEPARAERLLERAVKANPDSWQAHYRLALLLERQNKNKARFYFSRFLRLIDDDAETAKEERRYALRALSQKE
jgi:tetratricopeptide (TPR) repeat protein